ncbi:MAG: hypothetical protein WC829_02675 [Hyphomicrobium sp.]
MSTRNGFGVYVAPGCLVTSMDALAEGVAWDERGVEKRPNRKTVMVYLQLMQDMEMIKYESNRFGTMIFVMNWKAYQGHDDAKVTDCIQPTGQPTGQPKQHQLDTTKEVQEGEEGKEKKRTKKPVSEVKPSDAAFGLSEFFLGELQARYPNLKTPNMAAWAKDCDRLLRIDKRDPKDAEEVIRWMAGDFWGTVILSPAKLREKWDQIQAKRAGVKPGGGCSEAQKHKYDFLEETA